MALLSLLLLLLTVVDFLHLSIDLFIFLKTKALYTTEVNDIHKL